MKMAVLEATGKWLAGSLPSRHDPH
jgi:hypothetical protein